MADRIVVLDKGLIAQVGTPLELYDRPASRFVAEFIGSPAMNFLSGIARAGAFGVSTGHGTVEIPFRGAADAKEAVAGIRPEHFHPAERGIPGQVQVIEHLGAETYVFVDAGTGRDLCWRTPGRPDVRIGESITLGFDPQNLHLFDAASGARL